MVDDRLKRVNSTTEETQWSKISIQILVPIKYRKYKEETGDLPNKTTYTWQNNTYANNHNPEQNIDPDNKNCTQDYLKF